MSSECDHHRMYGLTARIVAATILVLAVLFAAVFRSHPPAIIVGGLFALAGGFALAVQRETVLDWASYTLCLRLRLFDRLTIWSRSWPLGEFDAIVRGLSGDPQSWQYRTMLVGLRRRSGGVVWIRYFSIRVETELAAAQEVIGHLSAQTSLPIEEVVV